MSEKNIRLTIDSGRFNHKHRLIISINGDDVEIRNESQPISSRDQSVAITVGVEPTYYDLVLKVEKALP